MSYMPTDAEYNAYKRAANNDELAQVLALSMDKQVEQVTAASIMWDKLQRNGVRSRRDLQFMYLVERGEMKIFNPPLELAGVIRLQPIISDREIAQLSADRFIAEFGSILPPMPPQHALRPVPIIEGIPVHPPPGDRRRRVDEDGWARRVRPREESPPRRCPACGSENLHAVFRNPYSPVACGNCGLDGIPSGRSP